MTNNNPSAIFDEYQKGRDYKDSLGQRGIAEQTKMNERFYVGDQWHGVQAGNTRPLVRRNIIKRIGEYKISALCAAPIAVNYSADGVPDTEEMREEEKAYAEQMTAEGFTPPPVASDVEINVVMQTLTEYFKVTSERLKFNELSEEWVKSAYIGGSAFLYTYWDANIETGLFADKAKKTAIKGDIKCEVLSVVNVVLGEPNNADIQSQPYIIISQRLPLEKVKEEAKLNKVKADDISTDSNAADYAAGDWGESEPEENNRVTVLTKFWKEADEKTGDIRIKAIRVTEKHVIREEWDLNLKLYPFAKFSWMSRFASGYGDSEITYLIPNQIAINRAHSATVWNVMLSGIPKMVVNRDLVHDKVTNEPGQVINLAAGGDYDVQRALAYVQPPQFASQLQNVINDIAQSTLSDSGANEAALGDIRPDNASAIIAMREAALQPMQMYQNRFYSAVEEAARIWADFWTSNYGERPLKVVDKQGTHYVPFDADRYKNLVIVAKVDVGASTLWGESVVVASLGNLLQAQIITPLQYLERLPKGTIPDITGLIEEMQQQTQAQASEEQDIIATLAQQNPELYAQYKQMSPAEQKAMLEQIGGV